MSEQYEIEEIKEAFEMLGKGYPSLELHPPSTVIRRKGWEMHEEIVPAFVKISTAFKAELKDFDAEALRVWLYIALSLNRYNNQAHPGIRTIAAALGVGQNTVTAKIKWLEAHGYLLVNREDRKYNIYEIPDYASANKTASKREATASENNETASENNATASAYERLNQINQIEPEEPDKKLPREKVLLIGKSLDWLIAHREQIDDDVFEECMGLVKAEEAERAATLAFESGLGFSGLPWNTPKFDKLRRCAIETHARDPQAFQAWAKERAREGQYSKKPSNDAIRRDPQAFADCWPSHFPVPVLAASAPEQPPDWYTKWEGAVPKPDNLPPPRIGRTE